MDKHTHQLVSGEAPGWAHCGAWTARGEETTEPTCPRCAAGAARENPRAATLHRTDAMEAFLSGDLLA
ncbi:hypothetical protein GCM10009551_045630 [Nocardiopsis tropica]|uniref:hypothetical protein n=1 Tax=Nocardiopsis tropica TaxID=109330 RepID=UPI0031D9A76E